MNTQRSVRGRSKANETPSGEFLSRISPPTHRLQRYQERRDNYLALQKRRPESYAQAQNKNRSTLKVATEWLSLVLGFAKSLVCSCPVIPDALITPGLTEHVLFVTFWNRGDCVWQWP